MHACSRLLRHCLHPLCNAAGVWCKLVAGPNYFLLAADPRIQPSRAVIISLLSKKNPRIICCKNPCRITVGWRNSLSRISRTNRSTNCPQLSVCSSALGAWESPKSTLPQVCPWKHGWIQEHATQIVTATLHKQGFGIKQDSSQGPRVSRYCTLIVHLKPKC